MVGRCGSSMLTSSRHHGTLWLHNVMMKMMIIYEMTDISDRGFLAQYFVTFRAAVLFLYNSGLFLVVYLY